MKSLALSMLAIASMAAMSSCSSENDPVDEVIAGNQEKVEIKLSAGVVKAETKAAVDTWSDTEVAFANKVGDGAYTTTPWNATIATDGSVNFVETHYYEADGKTTYLIGYYPRGTQSNGTVTYTLTGEDDIMVSQELSGTKSSTINKDDAKFQFGHLLSQLKLIVKAGENFDTGVKVTKITLKGTKKNATLTLGTTSSLKFEGDAADMDVYTGNADIASSTEPIKTIMVEPGVADMRLDITTDAGTTYSDIPITIADASDNKTAVNTAYDITLTFNKKAIEATASITAWKTGTGSADVF